MVWRDEAVEQAAAIYRDRHPAAPDPLPVFVTQPHADGVDAVVRTLHEHRDEIARAIRTAHHDWCQRPEGEWQDAAADAVLALLGEWEASDPPCPGCGMRAQVEPSRKEPGRYMCHGCARVFDAGEREASDG